MGGNTVFLARLRRSWIVAPRGNLAAAGLVPGVDDGTPIDSISQAAPGSLALVGYVPTISVPNNHLILAARGTLTVAGYAPDIYDGDFEVFVTVPDVSLTEDNSGTKNFPFVVTFDRTFPFDIQFDYTTVELGDPDAATANVDYESTSGTGTLPSGQTSVTINVLVYGDTDVEADELFDMQFSNFRAVLA